MICMPWQIIIFLPKPRSASSLVTFALPMSMWEFFLFVCFLMWNGLLASLFLGHHHPFYQDQFVHLCQYNYLLLNSSGCISRVYPMGRCQHSISSLIPLPFNLNLTSRVIIFCLFVCFFAALSSFLANSLVWFSIFVERHVGLLSMWKLDNKCAATSHQ